MATPNSFLTSPLQAITPDDEDDAQSLPGSQAVKDIPLPTVPATKGDEDEDTPPAPAPAADPKSLLPPPSQRPLFEATAAYFKVPVNVLMALSEHESTYNPNASNASGATGEAQYMPATAKNLHINPTDPNEAIPAMAQQLRERLDKGYSMADAIKEHFAGPNRKLWGDKTAAYGDAVLAKAGIIGQELYGDDPGEDSAPDASSTPAPAAAAAPDAGPEQNQFAPNRMSRAAYEKEFRTLNPKASDAAVNAVMAQYDQQAAARTQAAGNQVQNRFAQLQSPEATFDARLNAKLQGAPDGIVPQLPSNQQPDAFPDTSTQPSTLDTVGGNAVGGMLSTIVGAVAANAHLIGADDVAKDWSDGLAQIKGRQKELGGDTFAGKTASLIGGIVPAMVAAPESKVVEFVQNSGMFGIPAFQDTYKQKLAEGDSNKLALVHAFEAFGMNTLAPAIMQRGTGAIVGKLASEGAAGIKGAALGLGQAAGEGVGFSAANSVMDKGTDVLAGQQNDHPWIDPQDMAVQAAGFGAIRGAHMAGGMLGAAAPDALPDVAPPAGPLSAALDDAVVKAAGMKAQGASVVDQLKAIRPVDQPDPAAGPLESALVNGAAQHAANPASPPVMPAEPPQPPDLTQLSMDDLRNRLKDVAQGARDNPDQRKELMAERKRIEQEIGARGDAAVATSQPASEPLSAGPFDDMKSANAMMERYATETGQPHQVVPQGEQFVVKPMGGQGNGIDSGSDGRGTDGRERGSGSSGGMGGADGAAGGGAEPGADASGRRELGGTADEGLPNAGGDRVAANGAGVTPAAVVNPYKVRQFPDQARAESFLGKQVDGAQFDAVQTGQKRWQIKPRALEAQNEPQNIPQIIPEADHVPERPQVPEETTPASGAESPAPAGADHDQAAAASGDIAAPAAADSVGPAPADHTQRARTGGDIARERVQAENPFLAFLASHGIHMDERSDTGGQGGRAGVVMVPGYGALYRRSGMRIDELASLAHDAGFLSDHDMADPGDNGGTRKLADMIQRAVHGKEVIQPAADIEASMPDADHELFNEAARLGIDTEGKSADQVYDEVVAHHAAGFSDEDAHAAVEMALDADIPLDGGTPSDHLSDEDLDAIFGTAARRDHGETESDTGRPAHAGPEETGGAGEAAGAAHGDGAEPGDGAASGERSQPANDDAAGAVAERKDDPYTKDLFDGQDLFDDIDTRPGTLEAQKQTARAAVSDLARRLGIDRINRGDHAQGSDVSVLGSRLLANFVEGKPNQLVGQHAKTPHDLAALAQVYRDPRFETFRVFYMKHGEIVGEAGYTSRLPAAVHMPPDLLDQIQGDKARFGAQGFYLLHNHPSGRSEPSQADVKLTQLIDKHLPGLLGHVVIDHNEYSVIHGVGSPRTISAPHLNGRDFTGMPEMEHAMLGVKITSPDAVARAAKALQVPDGHATLILTNAKGETQLLVDVPMGALARAKTGDDFTRIKAMVRRMTREAGAGGHRFVVLPDSANVQEPVFLKMLAHGIVTDVVSGKGDSLQNKGFHFPGDFIGRRADETRRVSRIAEPTPEYGDDRTIEVDGVRHPITDSQGRLIGGGDFARQQEFWRSFKGETDESGRPILADDDPGIAREDAEPYGPGEPEEPTVPDNMRTRLSKLIGRPVAGLRSAAHDVKMLVAPMTAGTSRAMAWAKEFANSNRRAQEQWKAMDTVLRSNFNDAQLRKMWQAADEENDLRREGQTAPDKGLNALPKDQRDVVELLHAYGEQLWQRAKNAGLVDPDAQGVAYWTPRMAANIYADGNVESLRPRAGEFSKDAKNLRTSANSTKHRKHDTTEESEAALKAKMGDDASYVKNIRVMPLAMAQLEKAIAGRTLVNQIKAHGQVAGAELINTEGGKDFQTFDHPALKNWRPMMDWQAADQGKIADRNYEVRADGVYTEDGQKLKSYRVKDGEVQQMQPVLDSEGNPRMEPAPLFVHKDFVGPLKAVLHSQLGNATVEKVYRGLMALKGASMSLIMASPMTHNAVIWGKAIPSMLTSMGWKGNLKNLMTAGGYTYYMGHQWRQDRALMNDLVQGGLVPMSGRGMNPDIEAIGNGLKPGRSLMAKALGRVLDFTEPVTGPVANVAGKAVDVVARPTGRAIETVGKAVRSGADGIPVVGAAGKIAGGAVAGIGHAISKTGEFTANMGTGEGIRKNVDAAGHFWHETLLWDRIGDMQTGMAVQLRNHLMDQGVDQYTATRIATHFANRYAGAIPQEAMSQGAHALLNLSLFSKSFTGTNLGAMKDVVSGLPKDVQAQIREHFAGLNRSLGMNDIEAYDAAGKKVAEAQGIARKKAGAILLADFGAMAVITSLTQAYFSGQNGQQFLDDLKKRAGRLGAKLDKDNPLAFMGPTIGKIGLPIAALRHPIDNLNALSETNDNPHGKQDRIRIGQDAHGNSYYLRLPVGKVAEEMKSYLNLSSATDLINGKASPLVKGTAEAWNNKDFFGRSVYDKNANPIWQAGQVVGHILKAQVPFDDMTALKNLVSGNSAKQGDKVHLAGMDMNMDQAKLFGTATGMSVSKLTGGDAAAEMRYQYREQQQKLNDAMPDVKDAVMHGDIDKAIKLLQDAGQSGSDISRIIRSQLAPNAISAGRMRNFVQHASPEEVERVSNMMGRK